MTATIAQIGRHHNAKTALEDKRDLGLEGLVETSSNAVVTPYFVIS
ncbi:MAG: hypothetical protein ABSE20_28230 [Acetobacteraceae bacterium]|jgi:hypothetical protein